MGQEPNNSVYLTPLIYPSTISLDKSFAFGKSYARIVVKTTLLVSFLTVPQNEK